MIALEPPCRRSIFCLLQATRFHLVAYTLGWSLAVSGGPSFVNWETAPVHPLAISPDEQSLALANLPAARLEVFDLSSESPQAKHSIPVGLDPTSVRYYTNTEAWVVCHISDAINVVDLENRRLSAVIPTLDGPADVVFAGDPIRAYVSSAYENAISVYDPETRTLLDTIPIKGERPKAMAVSPDGRHIYAAIFESGNASTILAPRFGLKSVPGSPVDFHDGPYEGQNPPPNLGALFDPPIEEHLIEPPPRVGLIVKKNHQGRWLDDNQRDWTDYVTGPLAPLSGRPIGWDIPDRDVAVIQTDTHDVSYVTGLMNQCMDIAVNPVTGTLSVVGTDGSNEVRFEPKLNGRFLSVNLSLVDPKTGTTKTLNLNSHLEPTKVTLPPSQRELAIGDPRQVLWTPDGRTMYVTGMGSNNLLKLDAAGQRLFPQPIKLAAGPTGLALAPSTGRLFVYQRFASRLTVIDTKTDRHLAEISLFDPTPQAIRKGRTHFYNTHKTSGTGHTACASCHTDGRFDRLAWDLGTTEGVMIPIDREQSYENRLRPLDAPAFHPMKGPMMTMTLQDIIGHEPFHWRGDRFGIEAFNPTFKDLQSASEALTHREMGEFKAFLATIHFPPNRYRTFSNNLSRNVPLNDHSSLGRDTQGLRKGRPFTHGNAHQGRNLFTGQGACTECHTLSTGLGPHQRFESGQWSTIAPGPMGERHISLVQQPRSNNLPFKIASLRGMADKVGANFLDTESGVGFGFAHNGAVDSLTRFIQDGFNFVDDQSTADLIAFLLSFTGSEIHPGDENDELNPPGLLSKDTHAAVGAQFLLHPGDNIPARLQLAISMTTRSKDPVGVVAFQQRSQDPIGWRLNPDTGLFESDGNEAPISAANLVKSAPAGQTFHFLVVPPGMGTRMAQDWDLDGARNRLESSANWDPYSSSSTPHNLPPVFEPLAPQVIAPGEQLRLQLHVVDGNDPPDQITLRLADTIPSAQILSDNRLTWEAPRIANDQPWLLRVEAIDDGTPPASSTITIPVFVIEVKHPPVLESMNHQATEVSIRWRVTPGNTYQVEAAADIHHPAWLPVTAPWLADRVSLEVQENRSDLRAKFYRIIQLKD